MTSAELTELISFWNVQIQLFREQKKARDINYQSTATIDKSLLEIRKTLKALMILRAVTRIMEIKKPLVRKKTRG